MTARPKRRGRGAPPTKTRRTDYSTLRNPFPPMNVFSDDRVAAIHDAALDVLERLGIKVLHPGARATFKTAGVRVDDRTQMVHIGREVIEAALASAPKSFPLSAGNPKRDLLMELGSMVFQPGAGCPHATDLDRGRRPGTA